MWGCSRGIFLLIFLHPSEAQMGEKNPSLFCGENKPLFHGENPAKAAVLPHLEHLLWHDFGPLLADGDLGVGIEEDLDDLRHGRAGFQHLCRAR